MTTSQDLRGPTSANRESRRIVKRSTGASVNLDTGRYFCHKLPHPNNTRRASGWRSFSSASTSDCKPKASWSKNSTASCKTNNDAVLPVLFVVLPGIVHVEGAVPDDPDDDKIIAAAIEGQASYIVSEDRHLLRLREWNGIKIMNRAEFLWGIQESGCDFGSAG